MTNIKFFIYNGSEFEIRNDSTHVAAFRYNRAVDKKSQVVKDNWLLPLVILCFSKFSSYSFLFLQIYKQALTLYTDRIYSKTSIYLVNVLLCNVF